MADSLGHTFNMVGHCLRCGVTKRSKTVCAESELALAAEEILSAARKALKKS